MREDKLSGIATSTTDSCNKVDRSHDRG